MVDIYINLFVSKLSLYVDDIRCTCGIGTQFYRLLACLNTVVGVKLSDVIWVFARPCLFQIVFEAFHCFDLSDVIWDLFPDVRTTISEISLSKFESTVRHFVITSPRLSCGALVAWVHFLKHVTYLWWGSLSVYSVHHCCWVDITSSDKVRQINFFMDTWGVCQSVCLQHCFNTHVL